MKTKKPSVNIRPALLAVVLLSCSLSCLAWLNPKIEHGKVSVKKEVNPPIVKKLNDTVNKFKTQDKPLMTERKDVNRKSYMTILDSINDPHLHELMAKIEKRGKELQQHLKNNVTKNAQHDSSLKVYLDDPKLKRWQAGLTKEASEMDKLKDSPDMKEWHKKMERLGAEIDKRHNDPKFIENLKELKKAYQRLNKLDPHSAEFAKEAKKMAELSTYYAKVIVKPEFKLRQQEIAAMTKKVNDYYDSDDFKAHNLAIRTYSDSMAMFSALKIARKLKDRMMNPEIKADFEDLSKSSKELKDYMEQKGYDKKLLSSSFHDVGLNINYDTAKAPRPPKASKPAKKAESAKPKRMLPPPPAPAAPKAPAPAQ